MNLQIKFFFISFNKLIKSTRNSYEKRAMLYDDLFDKTRPRPRIYSYIFYFGHAVFLE